MHDDATMMKLAVPKLTRSLALGVRFTGSIQPTAVRRTCSTSPISLETSVDGPPTNPWLLARNQPRNHSITGDSYNDKHVSSLLVCARSREERLYARVTPSPIFVLVMRHLAQVAQVSVALA